MEIRINLTNIWNATKNAAITVKDTVVVGATSVKDTVVTGFEAVTNSDEEKIDLLMRTKNVDRAEAIKMLKEYRETKDKESAKSVTLDNLKR